MKGQSKMSIPTIPENIPNVISSLGSAAEVTLSGLPDGPTTDPAGQEAARVNLTPRQAKERGLLTSGTYGRLSSTLSKPENPSFCLANKLNQRLSTVGSTLLNPTFRELTTPSERSVWQLAASVPDISGKEFISWPTISAREGRDWSRAKILASLDKSDGLAKRICNLSPEALSQNPICGLNPCFAAMWMGYPPEWSKCAVTVTPLSRKSRRRSSKPTAKPVDFLADLYPIVPGESRPRGSLSTIRSSHFQPGTRFDTALTDKQRAPASAPDKIFG